MTFNSYLEHTKPIFKDFLTSLFMFRCHNLNNLPEVFSNYFVTNSQIHQHHTRNSQKLHKCYNRTNYVKQTLSTKLKELKYGIN